MAATNHTRRKALERHIRRIDRTLAQLDAKRQRYSRFRPAIFLGGIILAYWLGWTPFIAAIAVMSVEAAYDHRIGKMMNIYRLWRGIKASQLARMTLDWTQIPEPPLHDPDPLHPFENDLHITGRYSLHHLIDMAISRDGSRHLRNWLLQIRPDAQEISARQQIIHELTPLARFRDKLLLNFRLVSKEYLDGQKLLAWLQKEPTSNTLRRILPVSIALALLNLVLFCGYMLGWIGGYWVLSLGAHITLYFLYLGKISKDFDAIMLLYDELRKFKAILRYLETYPYRRHPHLHKLCQPFIQAESLPSTHLKRITWLTTAVGLRMNPALGLFLNLVVPWDMFFAYLVEREKIRCEDYFPKWVAAWAELEAFASLANFAYLHPDYTFPNIIPDGNDGEKQIFQAAAMGHPLIPAARKVCNDFSLKKCGEMILLTGSNMAGKSTFLKTLGVNLCLAYSGAPVNAAAFHAGLFRICTCVQIQDSLTDGFSFFYAEVKRLKMLLDAIHADDSIPVFFLIDEIFKGTNSRERLIGSQAYIQHISMQRSVGVIATHDLELGRLADQMPNLRNYHFRDEVLEKQMIFDYKLHPGLCPTTNALKIMKMEGLPV